VYIFCSDWHLVIALPEVQLRENLTARQPGGQVITILSHRSQAVNFGAVLARNAIFEDCSHIDTDFKCLYEDQRLEC
jgi:hypothetical protein